MGKIIDYINENLSLQEEYQRIFGRPMPNGKFICPNPNHVHNNRTPSCKAYGNKFKCFGYCNRVFGVYDLLKWYDPHRIEEIKQTSIITTTAIQQPRCTIRKVSVDKSQPIGNILNKIYTLCQSSKM